MRELKRLLTVLFLVYISVKYIEFPIVSISWVRSPYRNDCKANRAAHANIRDASVAAPARKYCVHGRSNLQGPPNSLLLGLTTVVVLHRYRFLYCLASTIVVFAGDTVRVYF